MIFETLVFIRLLSDMLDYVETGDCNEDQPEDAAEYEAHLLVILKFRLTWFLEALRLS